MNETHDYLNLLRKDRIMYSWSVNEIVTLVKDEQLW